MEPRRLPPTLRWVCVLPAVVASFFAAVFIVVWIDPLLHDLFVRLGLELPDKDYDLSELAHLPFDGALAAVFVIFSGTIVAPARRRVVALTLFVLGALVAINWLGFFRGSTPEEIRALEGTLVGGILAVACVFIATRRSAARPAPIPPGSTTSPPPA
jgi:UDP-N-acetylmuramyl pentapeptide phosphotransferase/UDP-N-acetylglucosamine-1-phosphate transferase